MLLRVYLLTVIIFDKVELLIVFLLATIHVGRLAHLRVRRMRLLVINRTEHATGVIPCL